MSGAAPPAATYSGNTYLPDYPGSGLVCSWTPAQVQEHYGLDAAYSQGLDGTGQTVVVIVGPADASQLLSDLAVFSGLAGLPAVPSSNFTVVYPDGQPPQLAIRDSSWQTEATIDVEWVHAIAPGAKIAIEILPSTDIEEFEFAVSYAVDNQLGNVISNSYGAAEGVIGPLELQGWEQVLEKSAAAGIAVNFASGDVGDYGDFGTGSPSGGGVSYPASSTYATGVGGTSLGIPNGTAIGAEVGWGTNYAVLSFTTGQLADPPSEQGFFQGTAGGTSNFFAKPFWQDALPGTARQSPDISALGDPFTGVVFVQGGVASAGIGGTSVACPIFSALWAMANQKAGASLGQAAPLLYALPSSAINDVVPVSSSTNVTGYVVDSSGTTGYTSDTLLAPLYTTTDYYSALWNANAALIVPRSGAPLLGQYAVLSFGTDSSLTVTPGWDNVTGLGVPNGLVFLNAAASAR
jgi:subtilase family serine protease